MNQEVPLSAETTLQQLHQQDESLFHWASTCTVTDPVTQQHCEDMLIGARYAYKRADEKRRELLQPIEQARDKINNLFKPYLEKLRLVITNLDRQLQNYHRDCLELAKEHQQSLLLEQAEKITKAKVTGEVIELPTVTEAVSQPSKTSHAQMGTVTYREEADIQIVNPDMVPRDLCEPSMPKIRARVKSGIVDIPGILVTKKLVTVARRV